MFVIVFSEEMYSCAYVIPSLIVVVNKGCRRKTKMPLAFT